MQKDRWALVYQKVLIVNPFGIGDVLFSTPIAANLKRSCPDCFVGFLCNKRALPALESNPNIDIIFVFEKDEYKELWRNSKTAFFKNFVSLLKDIKRQGFNTLIDLSLGDRYSLVCGLLGIRKRAGFNYKNRGRFLTDKLDISGYSDKHIVEYYGELLALLGLEVIDKSPELFLKDEDAQWAAGFLRERNIKDADLLIAVAPSSGRSWGSDSYLKRWDYAKFADVCHRLIKHYNAKIMLLGDTDDMEICNRVEQLLDSNALNLSGKTNLRQFAALISKSRLVISNDGGPLHIAVAVRTNTVSIFGPVDERVYGPYPANGSSHIVVKKDISCRPCYRNFKMPECRNNLECVKSITADEVFEAAEKLLCKSSKDQKT